MKELVLVILLCLFAICLVYSFQELNNNTIIVDTYWEINGSTQHTIWFKNSEDEKSFILNNPDAKIVTQTISYRN